MRWRQRANKKLWALEAVGALDEEERARLAEHLPSCAECREEMRELGDAAASLLYTVAPVQPSSGLRAGLLARVRGVDPSEVFVDPSEVVASRKAVDPSEARADVRTPAAPRDLRTLLGGVGLWQLFAWRPALGFGAGAAAVAVVLLGFARLTLWNPQQEIGR